MNLGDLKQIVIMIVLIAMIGAACAIALDEFQGEFTEGTDWGYNMTQVGLEGVDNATGYLDTIGTIAGVAVLISIVILTFAVLGRR